MSISNQKQPIFEITQYDQSLVDKVASDLVHKSAKVKDTDSVMILYDVGGRQLAKKIAELCAIVGSRVWYRVREMELESVLVNNLTDKNLARHLSLLDNEIFQADVVFLIRAVKDPFIMSGINEDKMAKYSEVQKPVYMDYRVNHTNWQLIYWPTPAEAEFENMTLDEYSKMFFDACNQPWDDIQKAQDELIRVLDKGKKLTLIADPKNPDPIKRTHLEMSIEGMTFVNSTINRNYPGSEVFSSPVRDSVNGHLYAQGQKMLGHEGKMVKNVSFDIKDGKIVEAYAEQGQKEMIEMLDRDEGARYFGEVAFGTNPGLRQNVFNGLLNEKCGGSFHITPGNAYENEVSENGKVTYINNGNKSQIHWDITIMMLPEYGGGEVIVDGKTIQKDGVFLIPGTEILNKGVL